MTLPPLSDDQRRQALTAAREARRKRADAKRALASGETTLSALLEAAAYDEVLASLRVAELLRVLPWVGEVRAAKVMARLGIAPNRRIRGLGRHQLAALTAEFDARRAPSPS